MKALSIRQPWAWLITSGLKTVENRTWKTNFRGRFFIHASKTVDMTKDEIAEFRQILLDEFDIVMPEHLPTGGIVGSVDLVDCVTKCDDENDAEWHEPGNYAFILRNAKKEDFIPMSGKLHFFTVD